MVQIGLNAKKGIPYWLEQSSSTPEGMEIVEGPLVRCKHDPRKALVQVLCHEASSVVPGTPFASLREMTEKDVDLLERTQDLEDHGREHTKARVAAQQEAEQARTGAAARELSRGEGLRCPACQRDR